MSLNKTINHLYYKKWPYKISCKVNGAHLLRLYKFNIDKLSNQYTVKFYSGNSNIDLQSLTSFFELGKKFFENKNIKKRIEFNQIDFYVLTETEVNDIKNCLKKFIHCITSPSDIEELKTLQINNNCILCKNLPHKKYKFKVTFKNMPLNIKQNLINWAEKYNNDEIYINNSTKLFFKNVKVHYYGSYYFYIKNKQMLTLLYIAASGYIRRTDEFISKHDINNN